MATSAAHITQQLEIGSRLSGHSLAMQHKNIASETKELQGRPKRSFFLGLGLWPYFPLKLRFEPLSREAKWISNPIEIWLQSWPLCFRCLSIQSKKPTTTSAADGNIVPPKRGTLNSELQFVVFDISNEILSNLILSSCPDPVMLRTTASPTSSGPPNASILVKRLGVQVVNLSFLNN